jgi:hypothetical protein
LVQTFVEKLELGEQAAEEERTPRLKLVSTEETFISPSKVNVIAVKNASSKNLSKELPNFETQVAAVLGKSFTFT